MPTPRSPLPSDGSRSVFSMIRFLPTPTARCFPSNETAAGRSRRECRRPRGLMCSQCGSRNIDMVVSGTKRR